MSEFKVLRSPWHEEDEEEIGFVNQIDKPEIKESDSSMFRRIYMGTDGED